MGCFASKEAVLEAQQQVGQHGQQKADGSKGGDGKAPSQQEPGAVSYSPKSTPVNDRARQYVLGSSPNTKDRVSNEQIQVCCYTICPFRRKVTRAFDFSPRHRHGWFIPAAVRSARL